MKCLYYSEEKTQSFKAVTCMVLFLFAASNNLISLWSWLVAPEQLSNSPSHLQGQHAGPNTYWQLRRVCAINVIRILSGTYLHNKALRGGLSLNRSRI
jgi:hypothetical protein